MQVLTLTSTPFNIQKCFLPNCDFLEKNFGRYCLVKAEKCSLLVEIALCQFNLNNALYLDDSVWVCSSLDQINTKRPVDTSFENFTVLKKPQVIKTINVTIVFSDFYNVRKYSKVQLSRVVKDILKLYTVCDNSIVYLNKLGKQNFGIFCIIANTGVPNQPYKIEESTDVVITKCISQLKFEQCRETKNPPIGGCAGVKAILEETINFSKCNKKGVKLINKILLIGPKGCGKSTLVRNIASDLKSILLEITPCEINSLTTSDTDKKLERIFDEAKLYGKDESCVVLIEDVDMMTCGKSIHARRVLGQLITFLEEVDDIPGIVVIATTNSIDDVDMQLRRPRRLEDELEISIPTADERVDILDKILTHGGFNHDEELLRQVSTWTPGFVGADLKQLTFEALMLFNKELEEKPTFLSCYKEALKKVIPSALKGTLGLCTTNTVTFSQIGGLEEIKKILDLSIKQQLQHPERFRRFGIPLTKGVLLYGPPGCAKTTLVKALANECNATFIATSAADLYSPFVGDAEKKIVQLFSQARLGSPSILFIDEIDAVVGSKSGDRERGVQERILSTLLVEMDGVGLKVNTLRDSSLKILADGHEKSESEISNAVIVVGATNRPQLLDDALKRPGRFDRLLYIPPPDEPERFRILKKLTEKMSLHESVDLEKLAKVTEFYSGADLKNLCQESGLLALRCTNMNADCIHQSHFEEILKEYKPSLNANVINFYESFQKYNI